MNLHLSCAKIEDVHVLAEMNKELIKDEGSRNPMSLNELEARMISWINNGNRVAILIYNDGKLVGYCVYEERGDEYFPQRLVIYVRQFYIKPEHRGHGVGKSAFEKIIREYFPKAHTITVDILETNPKGRMFWENFGFKSYYTNLVRENIQK